MNDKIVDLCAVF